MKQFNLLFMSLFLVFMFASCDNDDDGMTLASSTISYEIHNGQTVPSLPYDGIHNTDFSADMMLEELENGNTKITVTLNNTADGMTYNIHAHDAADAATTPNGTPYNESPNGDILVVQATGNGGSVSVSQEATMSYAELTETYEGFFVIHDPMQAMSTVNISTYLVVGAFARMQTPTGYESSSFNYAFNTGQLVADFAYAGTHPTDLSAMIRVDELAGGNSRISVCIFNTIDGEIYHTHAHDMADAATTPNGTPYIETPNSDVFVGMISGNGGTNAKTNISPMSYTEITETYDGFFVVHDPLQAITTVDPTTYVILGVVAR